MVQPHDKRGDFDLLKHSIVNPGPAEPEYAMSLQTVQIQISWLLQKPTDLDLHCLTLSIWICINKLDQAIWLAKNYMWACGILIYSAWQGLFQCIYKPGTCGINYTRMFIYFYVHTYTISVSLLWCKLCGHFQWLPSLFSGSVVKVNKTLGQLWCCESVKLRVTKDGLACFTMLSNIDIRRPVKRCFQTI